MTRNTVRQQQLPLLPLTSAGPSIVVQLWIVGFAVEQNAVARWVAVA